MRRIVTSATPAQLTSLLDLDLWRHAQPGRDDQFNVDRFGEWLEVLADTGNSVAARTVAALDERLLIPDSPDTCVCSTRARSNRRNRVMTSRWIATR